MGKEKRTYSLTAKERKALRLQEQEKRNKKNGKQTAASRVDTVAPTVAPEQGAPAASATEQTLQHRSLWVPIAAIALALVIILTAVLLLVFKPFNKETNSLYPRATITLDDGRKLTLTLWEEDAPIAATNFIFLSKIGFFTYSRGGSKGSLIYDVQEKGRYMRFGAYYDYNSTATRYRQADFLDSIPRRLFNVVSNDPDYQDRPQSNKFGYRLYKDSNDAIKDRQKEKYVISFNSNNAGDFVINMGEGNDRFADADGNNDITSYLVPFGQFEDERSQKILDDIFALPKDNNTNISYAIGTDPAVRIRKIEFSNMNSKKWKNFEFITYMKTARNGNSAIQYWNG